MRFLIDFVNLLLLFWCPADMAPGGGACVDRYEAPNVEGEAPMVMVSAVDAQLWCELRGKRLCREREWDFACFEAAVEEPCNNDKMWKPWDRKTANSPTEVARLWQGSPSGAYKGCRTPSGIFDLRGNVEEWVVSSEGRDWPFTLKGGWWAKTTPCYKSNDAHEPAFKFYQVGFRCCLTPW